MSRRHKQASKSEGRVNSFAVLGMSLVAGIAITYAMPTKPAPVVENEVEASDEIRPVQMQKKLAEEKRNNKVMNTIMPTAVAGSTEAPKTGLETLKQKPVKFLYTKDDLSELPAVEPRSFNKVQASDKPLDNTDTSASEPYVRVMSNIVMGTGTFNSFKKIELQSFSTIGDPNAQPSYPRPSFSMDGQYLIMTGGEEVRIYSTNTNTLVTSFRFSGQTTAAAALSPANSHLAVTFKTQADSGLFLRVFNFASWDMMQYLHSASPKQSYVMWTDESNIVTMDSKFNWVYMPITLSATDVPNTLDMSGDAKQFSNYEFRDAILTTPKFYAWSSDHTFLMMVPGTGRYLWHTFANNGAQVWSGNSGNNLSAFTQGPFKSQFMTLSADMESFVTLSVSGQITVYNNTTKQFYDYGLLKDRDGTLVTNVKDMVLSPDNRFAIFTVGQGNTGKALVYAFDSGSIISEIVETDQSFPEWVRFSPDARLVVTGTRTGRAAIWVAE